MGTQPSGMLTRDDLNDTDGRVLDVLHEGRVTPQYVADQLDVSRTYASERLKRLVEHGHVNRLASGLYELADDPRAGGPEFDSVEITVAIDDDRLTEPIVHRHEMTLDELEGEERTQYTTEIINSHGETAVQAWKDQLVDDPEEGDDAE